MKKKQRKSPQTRVRTSGETNTPPILKGPWGYPQALRVYYPLLLLFSQLAHSFLLRRWCYSTILCLLNKTLSYNQAVTLAHCFKSLLQWDWTEEITYSPDRINRFLFFRPPSLWYIVIVAYHSASSSNVCSFSLHTTKQFSDTIYICRVSYSFTQFWLLSTQREHEVAQVRAQSHKTTLQFRC